MAKVKFDISRCKGCGLCVLFCPINNLKMSSELNALGQPYPEQVDEEKCTGCGLCFRMCPDAAIEIIDSQEASASEKDKK